MEAILVFILLLALLMLIGFIGMITHLGPVLLLVFVGYICYRAVRPRRYYYIDCEYRETRRPRLTNRRNNRRRF